VFKIPKNNDKYFWTWHVIEKMKYYRISSSLVKRIIRHPERTEEGIALNTIASMKVSGAKRRQEVWVMYQLADSKKKETGSRYEKDGKIKIITAWRYPGESPKRNPVPIEILQEVKGLL